MWCIEIVQYPSFPISLCDVRNWQQKSTQKIANSRSSQRKWGPQALHALWCLVIEKLHTSTTKKVSATPMSTDWGSRMKMVTGTWPPLCTSPRSRATLSLVLSTRDAVSIVTISVTSSTPILWSSVIPLGDLYKQTIINKNWDEHGQCYECSKTGRGILNWDPMCRSNVVPCFMKKVVICTWMANGTNIAANTGSIRRICLVSSTWVTEHNIHGVLELVLTAALLRNLCSSNK